MLFWIDTTLNKLLSFPIVCIKTVTDNDNILFGIEVQNTFNNRKLHDTGKIMSIGHISTERITYHGTINSILLIIP